MAGTRTVVSNRVNSFFWNNINWHIGHHVYPTVPWYNLVELHRVLEPQIKASGAPVDKSYMAVYFKALCGGPESQARLDRTLAARASSRAAIPAAGVVPAAVPAALAD
jgi:fatty acid desaturase